MQRLTGSSRTMSQVAHTWPVLTAISLLAMDYSIADRPCVAYSSARSFVQLGSSFQVYCTFIAPDRECKKKHMCLDMKEQSFGEHNSTTIYLNVTKIAQNRTYSCSCRTCPEAPDPCGLDVFTGYPPGIPKNLTCVQKGELGPVVCSWGRERETYLGTISKLWVTIVSNDSTDGPRSYRASGTEWLTAVFKVPSTVQSWFSVWVEAANKLGSINSPAINFTLSDIVMPLAPELTWAECSSMRCDVRVKMANRTQLLEVQYLTDQEAWTTWPHTDLQTGPESTRSILFLEPYKLYNFRARTKFSTGMWSEWSRNISNWTKEEVPAKALDVWQTSASTISNITLHWKKLDNSEARGRILQYEVEVNNPLTRMTSSINTSATHQTGQFCSNCEVKVYAWNSKGRSPSDSVALIYRKDEPPPRGVSCEVVNNHSVAISWQEPVKQALGYVVEWYPAGRHDTHLSWHKVGPKERNMINIDNMKPYVCYEGAVYALYKGAVGRTTFRTATLESVPKRGPVFKKMVEGQKVTVSWKEGPQEHHRGCVISYTVYVRQGQNSEAYNCSSSARAFSTKLTPSAGKPYTLSMTTWTARGESPSGDSVDIHPQEGNSILLAVWLAIIAVFGVTILYLLYSTLCQNSAVHLRCLAIVPDPANSKWAKECDNEKGKLSLKFYLTDSSWSEDEPDTVDVQELEKESWTSGSVAPTADPTDGPHLPLLQPGPSPMTSPVPTLSPQSSYLKSFSLESDDSECTQGSQDTDTTVDYISTYGSGQVIEEVEDVKNDFLNGTGFLPEVFMGSLLPSEGKLTLDSVMIDCSDFENGL